MSSTAPAAELIAILMGAFFLGAGTGGPCSTDEAENRVHTIKAVMVATLGS